jgi:class 3 adenylate cyclase
MKTTISPFKPAVSVAEQAIVLIFDLEEFSKFSSQPDVQQYVHKFLNFIIDEIDKTVKAAHPYWAVDIDEDPIPLSKLPELIHSKFLGDGAMYIWKYNDFTEQQKLDLISEFWLLKLKFKRIVKKISEDIPLIDIPKKIRFGISAGTVYKLTYQNSLREEYIGYSINLASRLQNYCSDIGFIVSGRLNINSSDLEGGQYIRVVAQKIKGFPHEIVIIDQQEYEELDKNIKQQLFSPL